MSALVLEAQQAPKSLLVSIRRLPQDGRWVKNAKISTALWVMNFALLAIGMKTAASQVTVSNGVVSQDSQVNILLSITWDIVWFFINRRFIWPDRQVSTKKCVRRSAGAWLLFFLVNQAAFLLLTGRADVDWYYAKPLLLGLSISCGLARYFYNDRRAFANKTNMA